MPITNGKYVSPIWHNGAPPALDAEELQAMTDTIANPAISVYGVCDTPTNNSAKVVTVPNFKLEVGVIATIRFTNMVGGACTLNINGTGAHPILLNSNGVPLVGVILQQNTCIFVYSGQVWYLLSVDSMASGMSFSSTSWSTINTIASLGLAQSFWKIGDEKIVNILREEMVTVEIIAFNHDTLSSGGKASISLLMKNCLRYGSRMNVQDTNVGGWGSSYQYTDLNGNTFRNLPKDLRESIKPVIKSTASGGGSSTISTTSDKLWLLSYTELNLEARSTVPFGAEGMPYPIFIDDESRVKTFGESGTSNSNTYWTRSPNPEDNSTFYTITSIGGTGAKPAPEHRGIPFGFCI